MSWNVIGVDLSVNMLRTAKEKARTSKLSIEFIVGDAENLPFRSESFDVIISILSLCFINNLSKAIGEMKQVSKTGGKIIIGTLNKWSLYRIEKKLAAKFRRSVYGKARFHSILELKSVFGYGKWDSTLFALPWMPVWLLRLFSCFEGPLSNLLKPFGAFVVMKFNHNRQ